ncbi:MAG: hypothetical protein ACPHID_00565 [Thermoplasmatota archaeon]
MKLSELTNLYVEAKDKLEAERGPPKKQKAVEGLSFGAELIRDSALVSFTMGTIFMMIAIAAPPLHGNADLANPPTFIKPDWYLLWSLGPIFLAKWPIVIGGTTIIDQVFLGTLLTGVPVIAIGLLPFVAGGLKARRPVESPMNAAMGIFGIWFVLWMSIVGIADVIFAYEIGPFKGSMHWLFEGGITPSPSELINWLGIITAHQMLIATFLTYWLVKRHRPRYESKLNATYYKVR